MHRIIDSILLLVLIKTQSVFAGGFCDPNANCTIAGPWLPCPNWREPLRTCPTYAEVPVCTDARAACRLQCGRINDDANKNIERTKAEIQSVDAQVANIDSTVANLTQLQTDNNSTTDNQKVLCDDIDASRNFYINDYATQTDLITKLETVLNNSPTVQEAVAGLKSNPRLTAKDKSIIKELIEVCESSNEKLRTMIQEYKNNNFSNSNKAIAQALDKTSTNCSTQVSKLQNHTQNISNQKAGLENQKANLLDDRQNKVAYLQEQENRKCPSVLY